jgi:16S rRNA (guanine527-N7)-methyltransferase
MTPAEVSTLRACLAEAQQIGAISPGGLDDQLVQATGYFSDVAADAPLRIVDLGSGGGLPALPLALAYRNTEWVLVEAWARRAALLRRFVRLLELRTRVSVRAERAEVVGRSDLRGWADVVTARSFGPAAVTLECAAPLLRVGGTVRLSVRADDPSWPVEVLDELGLRFDAHWQTERGEYRRCVAVRPCPAKWPRRPGVPERKPLF